MEIYFTEHNYGKIFSVIINDKNVTIFRIENRDKIWSGSVLKIFIGKNYINGISGAGDSIGNSILLEVEEKKYMMVGESVYTFETDDKIIKFTSNVGNNDVPYPIAYGERNIYYLVDKYIFIPYESISDDNIRKRISEMDESYEPYDFLYNSVDGERKKFYSMRLLAGGYCSFNCKGGR